MEITSKKIYRNALAIVSFATLTLLLSVALIAGFFFEIFTPALLILGFFSSITTILCMNSLITRKKFHEKAIHSESIDTLQMLIQHGFLLNLNTKINGDTALIWAAKNGHHIDFVKALLDQGAKTDIKGQYGDIARI